MGKHKRRQVLEGKHGAIAWGKGKAPADSQWYLKEVPSTLLQYAFHLSLLRTEKLSCSALRLIRHLIMDDILSPSGVLCR